jgi:hypothetical protein
LKLAVLVSGVLALAKLGFLDFITGGFDTGRFGGLSIILFTASVVVNSIVYGFLEGFFV